jgi:GAF domain
MGPEGRYRAEDLLEELDRLRGVVQRLEQELELQRRQRDGLEYQLREAEGRERRAAEKCLAAEAQSSELANLYVASYRLHGTRDRREVVAAIQEIVANLIGSEELAVYETDPAGRTLRLVASYGIDPETPAAVPLGAGRIGRAAQSGGADVGASRGAPERAAEAELTACIPLKHEGQVVGALAVFRLLPQKAGFEPIDHELFELLATHAAAAFQGGDPRSAPQAL